jgi:hypothetical protein
MRRLVAGVLWARSGEALFRLWTALLAFLARIRIARIWVLLLWDTAILGARCRNAPLAWKFLAWNTLLTSRACIWRACIGIRFLKACELGAWRRDALFGRGDALLIFLTWIRIARIWLEWLACELWAWRRDAFLGLRNADGTWSAENGGARVRSGGGFLATFKLRAWSFDASDERVEDALLVLLARVAFIAWIRLLN